MTDTAARLERRLTELLANCDEEEAGLLVDLLAVAYQRLDLGDEVEGFALPRLGPRVGKDLEAQDKLGNFEIQDLLSRYNQAQSLASSVSRRYTRTTDGVIGKI